MQISPQLSINEPKGYKSTLGKLPPNVTVLTEPVKPVDLIQVFVASKKELESQLTKIESNLSPKRMLWITYPKGTFSKLKTDINRDIIRDFAQSKGLQAIAMVSVDDTWSALRLKIT